MLPVIELTFKTLVVGDIFEKVSSSFPNVMTESEALDLVQFGAFPDGRLDLIIGQGVDRSMIERAIKQRFAAEPGVLHRISLQDDAVMPRAVKRLAHKDKPANVCVGTPIQLDDSKFRLDLHFSASNEFFGDHMTGMHIQGMALTEAARQSFLAVSEMFYLNGREGRFYFVIKSFASRYTNFVFPLAAHIDYEVRRASLKDSSASFDVHMKLWQAETVCAEFDVEFTAFAEAKISERETSMMGERLSVLLSPGEALGHVPPLADSGSAGQMAALA